MSCAMSYALCEVATRMRDRMRRDPQYTITISMTWKAQNLSDGQVVIESGNDRVKAMRVRQRDEPVNPELSQFPSTLVRNHRMHACVV